MNRYMNILYIYKIMIDYADSKSLKASAAFSFVLLDVKIMEFPSFSHPQFSKRQQGKAFLLLQNRCRACMI